MLRMFVRVKTNVFMASSISSSRPPMEMVTDRVAWSVATTWEGVEYCEV